MEVAPDGREIKAFREKPEFPLGVPDDPDQAMVSMGNYVFDARMLVEAVTADAKDSASSHDVGGDIIPMLVERGTAQVFDFAELDRAGRVRARARRTGATSGRSTPTTTRTWT